MTNIELPVSVVIYTVAAFLTIGGTLVAIYVTLTNTLSNHKVRIHELESKVARMESVIDEHDDKFVNMFSEIKESMHRLELLVAKFTR